MVSGEPSFVSFSVYPFDRRLQRVSNPSNSDLLQAKYKCVLCLEEVSENNRSMFICCGQGTCRKCCSQEHLQENFSRGKRNIIARCPLCRSEDMGGVQKEKLYNIKRFADRGLAWAQYLLGEIYLGEDKDIKMKVDKEVARGWLALAEQQGHPDAVFNLAMLDYDAERDADVACTDSFERAANLGSTSAAIHVACHFFREKKWEDMVRYATIAVGGGTLNAASVPFVSVLLGVGIVMTAGIESADPATVREYYRAKHYLEAGARVNFDIGDSPLHIALRRLATLLYSRVLFQLGLHEYDGYAYEIPGHSFLPKANHWALQADDSNVIAEHDREIATHCANCNCVAPEGAIFKQCVRCRAAWCEFDLHAYNFRHPCPLLFKNRSLCLTDCTKTCQVNAWKLGHKFDYKQRF